MDRGELEQLDRDSLIAKAEASGVKRARILTRPELVDELLLRTPREAASLVKARGFFGRARDLLARIVERGLHLPDAAERIRGGSPPPPPRATESLPTVTLAEIYAAQGHKEKALETLRKVLEREPDHAAARALLVQLENSTFPLQKPALPPEEDEAAAPAASRSDAKTTDGAAAKSKEPLGMLDDAPLPPRYDVDECVAIPIDPTSLFLYWEIRDRTLEHMLRTRPGGTVAMRLVVITPTWDGPQSHVRDRDVNGQIGDWFERDLPAGAVVRAAVGWRVGDAFLPIAHSPALETPPATASPLLADTLIRWTPLGAIPVQPTDPDVPSIIRALTAATAHAREETSQARAVYDRSAGPMGSSERWTSP
jgi:hypothetical protein